MTTTSGSDGPNCSLADAIAAANSDRSVGGCRAGSGADVLILGMSATYTFEEPDNVTTDEGGMVPNALPSINSVITIRGNRSIVERANRPGTTEFRLFHVAPTGIMDIQNLSIRNGKSPDGTSSGVAGGGGCIFNAGQLTLRDSIVERCRTGVSGDRGGSGAGGGDGGGIANIGSLSLVRSLIEMNTTGQSNDNGQGGRGGGVYNGGSLVLDSSEVSTNSSGGSEESNTDIGGDGGGVFNAGHLESVDSFVCNNRTGFGSLVGGAGGGIFNRGVGRLTRTSVCDNITGSSSGIGAGGDGGGIANRGELSIFLSTITGNDSGVGTEPSVGARGGGVYNVDRCTIVDSVITANAAGNGAVGGDGGGIYNTGATEIVSSTISRNTAGRGAGDHGGEGGGLHNTGSVLATNITIAENLTLDNCYGGAGGGVLNTGMLVLSSSTVSSNAATGICDPGAGQPARGTGGGIAVVAGNVEISNTIVAGNYAIDGSPECSGGVASLRFSLVGDPQGWSVSGSMEGTISGVFPLLGPLEDNGGPVPTQALLLGSPAIDSGDPNGCTDAQGSPLDLDARGALRLRPDDLRCDIGAFEFGSVPPVSSCPGDCNGDAMVDVAELSRGVNISLGYDPITVCPQIDVDHNRSVTVDEIVSAVGFALKGCK